MSSDGKIEESWIPGSGFSVNPGAFSIPTLEPDDFTDELAFSCNTSKEKHVQRLKIAGINIVSFPCGTIVDVAELYGSESLSQVLLPLHSLMKIPSIRRDVKVLIHDNACRFKAFVSNRVESSSVMKHIDSLDMRVDRHHYRNHTGKKCTQNHNPDKCPLLKDVNTSVMEQVNRLPRRKQNLIFSHNEVMFDYPSR